MIDRELTRLQGELRRLQEFRRSFPLRDEVRALRDSLHAHRTVMEEHRRTVSLLTRGASQPGLQAQLDLQRTARESLAIARDLQELRAASHLVSSPFASFLREARRVGETFRATVDVVTEAIRSFPAEALQRLIRGIESPATPVGAFTVDEDAEAPTEESSELWLPPSVTERLERVEFLPVRLTLEIAKNPGLMRGLDPRRFEELIAQLIEDNGFEKVKLTPASRDGGRDIIAVANVNGIEVLFAFECKRYSHKVGVEMLRTLLGTIGHAATQATMGVLVTTSYFTNGAREFMVSEPRIDGRDFDGVVDWLRRYDPQR
jgi:hypothetical protein